MIDVLSKGGRSREELGMKEKSRESRKGMRVE